MQRRRERGEYANEACEPVPALLTLVQVIVECCTAAPRPFPCLQPHRIRHQGTILEGDAYVRHLLETLPGRSCELEPARSQRLPKARDTRAAA